MTTRTQINPIPYIIPPIIPPIMSCIIECLLDYDCCKEGVRRGARIAMPFTTA
jgi:hypothetical protein